MTNLIAAILWYLGIPGIILVTVLFPLPVLAFVGLLVGWFVLQLIVTNWPT